MKNTPICENFVKMNLTILMVLLQAFLLVRDVSSICVNVPNDDMIEYSCTAGIPSDLYVLPHNVQKIRIINMSIPLITRQTFSRYGENLWVLTCSNCDTYDIEDDAFARLVNLQQLRLDNNHLRSVRAAWFVGMKHLTYLDLNYNDIENIDDDVYANVPSLVEFRISGNRLKCLNVTAMSSLPDLDRIFLSQNPDFKCPNAVSKYLEERGINFARDPEWRRISHDLVEISGGTNENHRSSTPSYHEKLISRTTTENSYDYYDYETILPNIPNFPTTVDENSRISTSSQASHPTRDHWPFGVTKNYDQTTRDTPVSSMKNFPPYDELPIVARTTYRPEILPTLGTTDRPTVDRSEWHESPPSGHDYERTVYKPEIIVTSTIDTLANNRRPTYDNLPFNVEAGIVPVTQSSNDDLSPPRVEWYGNSGEIFEEIGYPNFENSASIATSERTISSSSVGLYSSNVQSSSGRSSSSSSSSSFAEDYYQPPRNSEDSSQPRILEKFQQVQEPDAVTVLTRTKEITDKPLPDCPKSSSSSIESCLAVLTVSIVPLFVVKYF